MVICPAPISHELSSIGAGSALRYEILDSRIAYSVFHGYLDKLLVFGFFLPEAPDRKASELTSRVNSKASASIIRAICTFDAKKALEYRFVILVTRFGKVS